MNIGPTVRSLKDAAGMSIFSLAEAAGLSNGYVALILGSKRQPSLDTVGKLADALGVPMAALLGGKDANKLSGSRTDLRLILRIRQLLKGVPLGTKRQLLSTLRLLRSGRVSKKVRALHELLAR